MNKLPVKEQASRRNEFYMTTLGAIQQLGLETEVVSNGALIRCEDGQRYRLKIQYCNPDKFSLEKERKLYLEKLDKAASRAEQKAKKAKDKAERQKLKD